MLQIRSLTELIPLQLRIISLRLLMLRKEKQKVARRLQPSGYQENLIAFRNLPHK